jgi:hypothetical protein
MVQHGMLQHGAMAPHSKRDVAQLATAKWCEFGTAQCKAVATRRTMLQRRATSMRGSW